jgi:hypothetical protein
MVTSPVPHDAVGVSSDAHTDPLWTSLALRLGRMSVEGLRRHRSAPLAAHLLRSHGLPVAEELREAERRAAIHGLGVVPLLEHVRAGCDGPLLLMKGPEIALRYPGGAREFHDIDLLAEDAQAVHSQLRAHGFHEVGDPRLFHGIHHLRPLKWPTLPLVVEVHTVPKWPARLKPPRASEIIEAATRPVTKVEGILAPNPAQHALLVAAHAWAHEPLRNLRDLVDVSVLARAAHGTEIERVAEAWGIGRLWRTTARAAQALTAGRSAPASLRLWGRHIAGGRERTVLEFHLQDALSGYWALPPRAAVRQTAAALSRDLGRTPEDSWPDKLRRSGQAVRDALVPLSQHNERIGDAATRGRRRSTRES